MLVQIVNTLLTAIMQGHYFLHDRRRRRSHPIRQVVGRAQALAARRKEDGDIRLFVLSFTAFFVCFYTFIV